MNLQHDSGNLDRAVIVAMAVVRMCDAIRASQTEQVGGSRSDGEGSALEACMTEPSDRGQSPASVCSAVIGWTAWGRLQGIWALVPIGGPRLSTSVPLAEWNSVREP